MAMLSYVLAVYGEISYESSYRFFLIASYQERYQGTDVRALSVSNEML
jgi:hypothetical protein